MGPKTEPCGTPQLQEVGWEVAEPILTDWSHPVRYDCIHSSATSSTSKVLLRRHSRVEWTTMSRAAEMSRATRMVAFPWSIVLYAASVVRNSDVSVEWCRRYVNWAGLKFEDPIKCCRKRESASEMFTLSFHHLVYASTSLVSVSQFDMLANLFPSSNPLSSGSCKPNCDIRVSV